MMSLASLGHLPNPRMGQGSWRHPAQHLHKLEGLPWGKGWECKWARGLGLDRCNGAKRDTGHCGYPSHEQEKLQLGQPTSLCSVPGFYSHHHSTSPLPHTHITKPLPTSPRTSSHAQRLPWGPPADTILTSFPSLPRNQGIGAHTRPESLSPNAEPSSHRWSGRHILKMKRSSMANISFHSTSVMLLFNTIFPLKCKIP